MKLGPALFLLLEQFVNLIALPEFIFNKIESQIEKIYAYIFCFPKMWAALAHKDEKFQTFVRGSDLTILKFRLSASAVLFHAAEIIHKYCTLCTHVLFWECGFVFIQFQTFFIFLQSHPWAHQLDAWDASWFSKKQHVCDSSSYSTGSCIKHSFEPRLLLCKN